MLDLKSPFTETEKNTYSTESVISDKFEVNAMVSPISKREMNIIQCNGIPVYVDMKDRVCLPVEENKKIF